MHTIEDHKKTVPVATSRRHDLTASSTPRWRVRAYKLSFRPIQILPSSHRCFRVALLISRNLVFPIIRAILLWYKKYFSDYYLVKFFRMDNALEFKSHAFEDYCTILGITLTYSAPYERSQNGLVEAFIKKLRLVFRPLSIHAKLPDSF